MKQSQKSNNQDDDWYNKYILLLLYRNKYGHCNIPKHLVCQIIPSNICNNNNKENRSDDNYEDINLGLWLYTQRVNKRKNKLSSYRLDKLQKLVDNGHLLWDMDKSKIASELHTNDEGWELQYNHMIEYSKLNNGSCNIPQTYVYTATDGSTYNLGTWLISQRQFNKNNKLSSYRFDKLQKLVDEGKLKWNMHMNRDI